MGFGVRMRYERMKRNIPLSKLSRDLEVSVSYLSDIEKERKRAPTEEMVERIISALSVDDETADKMRSESSISRTRFIFEMSGHDALSYETIKRLHHRWIFNEIDPQTMQALYDLVTR